MRLYLLMIILLGLVGFLASCGSNSEDALGDDISSIGFVVETTRGLELVLERAEGKITFQPAIGDRRTAEHPVGSTSDQPLSLLPESTKYEIQVIARDRDEGEEAEDCRVAGELTADQRARLEGIVESIRLGKPDFANFNCTDILGPVRDYFYSFTDSSGTREATPNVCISQVDVHFMVGRKELECFLAEEILAKDDCLEPVRKYIKCDQ